MTYRPGPTSRGNGGSSARRAGFTLIEVMLAIALMMLLSATAVLALGPWRRNAALGEGSQRVETLLRALSAEAAGAGRRMRLGFTAGDEVSDGIIVVEWEAQPLERPGEFEPYRGGLWQGSDPSGLVRVVACRLVGPSAYQALDAAVAEAAARGLAPVTFYPDGSSDWAQLVLASRHAGDARRSVVELNGMTGTIHTALYADEQYEQQLNVSP